MATFLGAAAASGQVNADTRQTLIMPGTREAVVEHSRITRTLTVILALLTTASAAHAQALTESLLDAFTFRNLGPFRTGAWVTDFAVPVTPARDHLYTFWVATRNGGLWKTVNNGTTFEPMLDDVAPQTIGAVAVAPTDPDIVWVGTGEAYLARYTYSGDGVYRSTDGGGTWRHMGLDETHHIVRILIHPRNPDIVYVATMGHLDRIRSVACSARWTAARRGRRCCTPTIGSA
jgi:hypothetical protein